MSSPSIPCRPTRLRLAVRAVSVITLLGLAPSALLAESKTWVGNNGDWNNDFGWISFGRPRDGDSAFLGNASGTGITVTYSNTTVSLGELNLIGGNDITLFQTGGSITSVNEKLGNAGFPVASTHRQEFGINTVSGTLTIGDPFNASAVGLYELNGGNLDATAIRVLPNGTLSVAPSAVLNYTAVHQSGNAFLPALGLGSGRTYDLDAGTLTIESHGVTGGTFNQTGGAVAVSRFGAMFNGEYNLSGGELRSTGYQMFAQGTDARFVQTGGSHVITGAGGTLGLITSSSNATYELRGGDLAVAEVVLTSQNASFLSLFNQSGGTFTINSQLQITNGGGYLLQNGALNAPAVRMTGGFFDHVGGTLNADVIEVRTGAIFIHRGGMLDAKNFFQFGGTVVGVHNKGNYFYEGGDFPGRFVNDGNVNLTPPAFLIQDGLDNRATFPIPFGRTVTLGGTASVNSGTISMDNAILDGTSLVNLPPGRLAGYGGVQLPLENHGTITAAGGNLTLRDLNNSGTIENSPGSNLFVTGKLTNAGDVVARAGGSVVFTEPLLNRRGRTITLLGGTLASPTITNEADGTFTGTGDIVGDLVNGGSITFNGPTRVFGKLTNNRRATITVRNDQVLVTGAAVNDGQITTTNGTIVFDGGVTGAGGEARGETIVGPGGNVVAGFVFQSLLALDGTPKAPAAATIRRSSAGGIATIVGSLRIAGNEDEWHGRLDLADTDLLIRTTPNTFDAVRATVESQVAAARNAPAGRWLGNGVTSSAAAADPLTTLAVGLSAGEVLVRHTYNGDANLDGRVNADDYFQIDSGFLAPPQDPLFVQGDFNYDDRINADDYFLIDSAFLGQGAPLASATASTATLSAAAVPEPAMTLLGLYGACVLLKRRRPMRPSSCGNLLKVAAVAAAG